MDNSKFEHRSVIKFLTLEGEQPQQILDRMKIVYEDECPSYSTVKKWCAEFKRGRKSIGDDPRTGRPVEGPTPENIEAVRVLVEEDRRVKIRQIAQSVGVSYGTANTILHEHLGLSKLSARWIPRILSVTEKQRRADTSLALVNRYNADPEDFLRRTVTGDEVWVHHHDPESKEESKQWTSKGACGPLKARAAKSAGKVMATIFWDARGTILVDYLPRNQTMNGQYYAELLTRLRIAIREKRRGNLARGPLLLHDNAPVHTSQVAQAAMRDCGFEQIPHPAYSPDLAPSDYHLSPNLKKFLRGRRFPDDESLKEAVHDWLEEQDENFYRAGMEALRYRCLKCFNFNGDYVEKLHH